MLQGKAGIVTGAGGGIGEAIARILAGYGASVVVNDLGASLGGSPTGLRPAETVAESIRTGGGRAIADCGSVTSAADVQGMVARCQSEFGRLDFVVHNAGILRDAIFHKMTEDDWDAVIGVHLKGAFLTSRAAAEVFRAQGHGAIVHMTSTSGLCGNVGQANYSAAKLGIVALTRSIALDMRRFGVRANAIAPFAWTRMTDSIPVSEDPKQQARLAALQRCRPEHVAEVVAWLVSDTAADVSGQVFAVRGAEVTLFGLPKPVRTAHHQGGWTAPALAAAWPSLARDATALATSAEVFCSEPLA
jgi:NAD(P)-dependent dehydrogenase (short-subunit alcohol dehydrogenase family)